MSGGGRTAQTEKYDGSSWTITANMSTLRSNRPGGAGDTSAGLAWAGRTPAGDTTTATEEFNPAAPTTVTISGS